MRHEAFGAEPAGAVNEHGAAAGEEAPGATEAAA